MIWRTVMRGLKEPKGSWKTICMRRRSGRMRLKVRPWIERSSKVMGPSLDISRSSASASVVLPEPLSPTTPTVCPSRIESVTPSTAFTWPTVWRKTPALMGKWILRSSQATTSSASLSTRQRLALGLGRDQRLGVRVFGRFEDALRRPRLHDGAVPHDADTIGYMPHDGEVVGDQQHRHA